MGLKKTFMGGCSISATCSNRFLDTLSLMTAVICVKLVVVMLDLARRPSAAEVELDAVDMVGEERQCVGEND